MVSHQPIINSDSEDDEFEDVVYIDLDIEIEGEINGIGFRELSVAEFLTQANVEPEATPYDFDVATKLCEDIPCMSHTLDLVATADFKKILDFLHPVSLKISHKEAFGKLKKLWNISNSSIRASKIIYNELGRFLNWCF